MRVQMPHREAHLGHKVLRHVLGQALHGAQQTEAVPALHVLHNQKELVLALEGEQQLHEVVRVPVMKKNNQVSKYAYDIFHSRR